MVYCCAQNGIVARLPYQAVIPVPFFPFTLVPRLQRQPTVGRCGFLWIHLTIF